MRIMIVLALANKYDDDEEEYDDDDKKIKK